MLMPDRSQTSENGDPPNPRQNATLTLCNISNSPALRIAITHDNQDHDITSEAALLIVDVKAGQCREVALPIRSRPQPARSQQATTAPETEGSGDRVADGFTGGDEDPPPPDENGPSEPSPGDSWPNNYQLAVVTTDAVQGKAVTEKIVERRAFRMEPGQRAHVTNGPTSADPDREYVFVVTGAPRTA